MAKIKRTIRSSVGAPDLTQRLQQIDIPGGAFGENVAAELANLGGTVADTANRLNLAFARQEDRRATTEATNAFKDIPINELNALEQSKQNPGPLDQFPATYLKAFDDRSKAIRETLTSERAKLKFDQKLLATRTTYAKNAIVWARGQEVQEARNSMNAEINNQISAAVGNIGQIQDYRDAILDTVNVAKQSGSLIGVDSETFVKQKLRELDLAVANSLIPKNPASMLRMIEDGHLPFLTDDDKRKKISQANSSLNSLKERQEFSRFSAEIAKDTELSKRIDAGDPTLTVSEIQNSDLSDFAKDYWIEELSGSVEGRIRKGVQRGEEQEEIKRRLGKDTGKKAKRIKFDDTVKRATKENLNNEFLEIAGIEDIEDFTGVKRLNATLAFITKVLEAHKEGKIDVSDRRTYLELLTPSLTEMIDSKYWEGPDNKDSAASQIGRAAGTFSPFNIVNKLLGGETRKRNVYADFYNSGLSTLEKSFPVANNETGRVEVMANVIKHIDIASKLEGKEQVDYVQNIGRNAVIDIMYKFSPETVDIPYDDYFEAVGLRVPVEGDTIESPSDFGLRPDGTRKGKGFIEGLKASDGTDVSEFSVQSDAVKVDGKRIDFPTIVPTLTQDEIDSMLNDIIPNNKPVPEPIMQKAIAHANKRLKQGLSVFKEDSEPFGTDKQARIDAFFKGK